MKNKIIILQGPPASGKSTFARELAKAGTPYVIVNRDSIREGRGEYWIPDQEDYISDMEEYAVRSAVKRNLIPIIDATNLNPKTIEKWENLAKELNCEIEYKKFYIPFTEALERDSKRERPVGKKVLIKFYTKYFYDEYVKEVGYDDRKIYEGNHKSPCVVIDLDGTTMLHNGRLPFDWNKVSTDIFDPRMLKIINKFYESAVKIIFLTGRPESVRNATDDCLNSKLWFGYELIMRPINDNRSGDVLKKDLWEKYIDPYYNTLCVFEDSNKCVDMWRDLGLLTCQVANGDY
jgi:predicted kinase